MKRLTAPLIFLCVWLAWFAWYRLTSNVIERTIRYPNGAVQEYGLVRRQADGSYKRHGVWSRYHANGALAWQAQFANGVQVSAERTWNADGTSVNAPATTQSNEYPNNHG